MITREDGPEYARNGGRTEICEELVGEKSGSLRDWLILAASCTSRNDTFFSQNNKPVQWGKH